jgi:hypothetical protein
VCYVSIIKGGNIKTVFPKKISPRGLRTLLVGSHQQKIIILSPDVSTKPKKQYYSPCGYSLLKKGSDEKVKIEGKICSERAAKAMEKKTVYNKKQLSRITKTKKNQKTKTKRNKFTPATKNPSLIIVVSPLRSLASSQTKGGLQRQFVKRRSR